MFGHNSFVWTPVNVLQSEMQVFNATGLGGIEAPADYTGPFVIIEAGGSGFVIYNEDGSRWSREGWTSQVYGTTDEETRETAIAKAVAALPNDIYYKVRDGGHGRFKTDIPPPDYTVLCPSLNREIKEMSGQRREGADAPMVSWTKQGCGKCLSGFKEPGDRGEDYSCSDSGHLSQSCDDACILEVMDDGDGEEEEKDTNWLMIGGGIAGVIALAFFGMG